VVSIAAFAHPTEVTERYLHALHLPHVITLLVIRYVEWLIGYRFDGIAPVNTVCRIICPVLLVHGRDGQAVQVDDAHRIADRCGTPHVHLLAIADAGHDYKDQIQRYAAELLRFLEASWGRPRESIGRLRPEEQRPSRLASKAQALGKACLRAS
jgi:pimeloyl-ACP methyl ester carboxylesterase